MDPMTTYALAAAGTAAVTNYLGQNQANETNARNAREANAMSWNIAQSQQQFQERMSNTARQREVADLKKRALILY